MKRRWRRQRFALLLLGFLLLLAAVFPWRIWLAMQNEVRLLEGCQYYVNIASPLSIHVKGDKAGILTSTAVRSRRKAVNTT